MSDCILYNATIATITPDGGAGLMPQGAIIVEHGVIRWTGKMADIPATLSETDISHVNCGHRLVTPGLIDCHTHLVYGGDRAMEFEQRLEGVSYEQIANQGGGIVSTVTATRAASEEELYHSALVRLRRLIEEGVTTVEIKSGYGLDCENEIKMLNVARQLELATGIRIKKTFLAAHALPVEFSGRQDEYIDHVCDVMLPAAIHAGVVDAVDGFCEGIAFSVEQIARVFDAAIAVGLPVKLHAEQLSNLGGAVMAAEKGALSVDHIEYLAPGDVPVLALNGTVAVLLPGAFYTLRESQLPPLQALRDNRVPIAIATDLNPGSSPLNSLLLAMNMACTLFALTPTEALAAVTINAARALGLEQEIGSIETGKRADLAIWDAENPAMLSYLIGANPCAGVMAAGHWIKPPVLA